jgi:hypothetical protein
MADVRPTFAQVYLQLQGSGPCKVISSRGTEYQVTAYAERSGRQVMVGHLKSGAQVRIHEDCWGKDLTCQRTRAGGIFNGSPSIYDWYASRAAREPGGVGRPDSVLTGSAGEHYVLYKLHREGILAAQSPTGAREADILVFDRSNLGKRVQVKTRTHGADGGWHMGVKHERIVDDGLIYAFVDLEPEPPVVYLVPSRVVAGAVAISYKSWLTAPGVGGRPHRQSDFRRLLPEWSFPVEGFEGRWLEQYRDRWDLLR